MNIGVGYLLLSLVAGKALSAGKAPSRIFPELTDETFSNSIYQYGLSLVMFLAPWCGHCKKLHPEVELAAETLMRPPHNMLVAQVDCTGKGKKTCERRSISGYPTLKMFRKGKFWKEYDGDRNHKRIIAYMVVHSQPCPSVLNDEQQLDEFVKDGNAYVGFFQKDSKDSILKDVFLEISEEQRGYSRMAISEVPEMIEKYSPQNGIVFFRWKIMRTQYEPDEIAYEGNSTKEDLEAWAKDLKHGLLGLRDKGNSLDFSPPQVFAYFDYDYKLNPQVIKYWRNRILKVAINYKEDFNFAVSQKYDFLNDFFNYGYNSIPGHVKTPIVLAKTDKGKFKMGENFTVKGFDEFLRKLKGNELRPFLRSAQTPEKNEGPVKIVVADTFEDVVMNSGRDGFILFYSPSTDSSKLLIVWKDLGKRLDDEDVDILQMDVTKNDVSPKYELVGFPTMYWLPKLNKTSPIQYIGDRTLIEMIKFVASTSTEELKNRNRSGALRKIKKTEL